MKSDVAKSLTVLVAEDQTLAKSHLRFSLEELGFRQISYVERASYAYNELSQNHYDIVLCAYDLGEEQRGYGLFEQLKRHHHIPLTTAFIFTSADTAAEVVHAIVELQPDEFIAKPFTTKELDKRISRAVQRKRVFKSVYAAMESEDHDNAITQVNRLLASNSHSQYAPLALKLKGDLLLASERFEDALHFFEATMKVQAFSWAQLGLVKCLLQKNQDDAAEKLLLNLAMQPDCMLAAYDLLSNLQIKNEAYDDALECVTVAGSVSPRNVARHKTAMALSRLTHDYACQFDSAKKVVRYGKHSIHDKPESYLNVARAGIDYAMTSDSGETASLIRESTDYLRELKKQHPSARLTDEINVINARMLYLKNETEQAKVLLEKLDMRHVANQPIDAQLDTAKALHEVGLRSNALALLAQIEVQCEENGYSNTLLSRYIKQEKPKN
ncbi:response regulator [Alteromonas sp. KUL49]|uniref:response regulator n=1 Tax=Alteromonas sp. KUL49 TaxID=2480798 RepID=UPI0010FFAC98|nr:response regulator [Alteromonas sp. KUL49]GEA10268.1 hypothetical protein KUL49_06430 [Alteromonas sp. KUL49]